MSLWDLGPKHKLLKEMFTQPDLKVIATCPIHGDQGMLQRRACLRGVDGSSPSREGKQGMEADGQCLWSWLHEKTLLRLVGRNRNPMGKWNRRL